MDSINITIPLNSTEIWTLKNNTLIAHPFHIHDIQFNVIEKNGTTPPVTEQGWKDVVLVMPEDSVKFITKFTTFTDEMVPYMYHCHLLHHEDDGMMGSFLVVDPFAGINENEVSSLEVFPNPSSEEWNITGKWGNESVTIQLTDVQGKAVLKRDYANVSTEEGIEIPASGLNAGIYFLTIVSEKGAQKLQLVRN